jgi:hypothetical protein
LHAGVHVLSRASGAPVIPVSISYTFREGPAPSAIVSLGEAIHARDRAELMAELERSLVHGLDCNDAFAVNGTGSYRSVIAPRATDGVPALGRAIARLMRGGRDA